MIFCEGINFVSADINVYPYLHEAQLNVKRIVFLDLTLSISCQNRRFGVAYHLHHQGRKNQRIRNNISSNQQLLTFQVR
jgi:hypothetical protein